MITSGSFAKDLWPGVNAWYGMAYKELPMLYTECFETHKSTRAWEEDVGFSGLGLFQVKTEGSAVTYDDMSQGFVDRYVHTVYALGFIITREMKDDGLAVSKAAARARQLARSARVTKETIAANVYNRAFNSSYTFGDGKELCSTLHPHMAGGTWRNELSTAADLSEAALEQAIIDIGELTDDRSNLIAARPLQLLIPPELQFEASRILDNPDRPGTAERDINAMYKAGHFPKGWFVNNYFTDADAWFIRTDVPEGMKYFERRGDEFGIDNDFDTENAKFKATFRCSFGCSDKRQIFGSPGA